MLDLLKEIILDSQEKTFFTGVKRNIEIETVTAKASILMGVRRSGKSTFLHQILKKIKDSGVSASNILYINLIDERLHALQKEDLSLVTEAYYQIYPEKRQKEKIYCFFDEIQWIEGWESYIDRLQRSENCEIYISGSSAKMLSREIASQMRGRSLAWEIFPFSFREFLKAKNISCSAELSSSQRQHIQKAFAQFWESGSFPEVIDLPENLRIKVLQEYFQTILYRDLIERHDIGHPRALKDLAHRLLENCGNLYSQNRLYQYLKSLGHHIQKSTVADYLDWLEDSYFIFSVPIYEASLSKQKHNPRKCYCIDHALVRAVSSGILLNKGHLLENLVYINLRRISSSIFYYKTASSKEVDFILQDRDNQCHLFQVSLDLYHPQTRKRELSALNEAMAECNLQRATLVCMDHKEEIDMPAGRINVIPVWKFLLDVSQLESPAVF